MKKIYKKILILIVFIYFVFTLVSQQQTLNTYKTAEKQYSEQLDEAKETNEDLVNTKNNISSLNYIEELAREKLNMYLPNERVYVDIGK